MDTERGLKQVGRWLELSFLHLPPPHDSGVTGPCRGSQVTELKVKAKYWAAVLPDVAYIGIRINVA